MSANPPTSARATVAFVLLVLGLILTRVPTTLPTPPEGPAPDEWFGNAAVFVMVTVPMSVFLAGGLVLLRPTDRVRPDGP